VTALNAGRPLPRGVGYAANMKLGVGVLLLSLLGCSSSSTNVSGQGGSGGTSGAGGVAGSGGSGGGAGQSGGAAGASGGGSGDAGVDSPACTPTTVLAKLTADTTIIPEGDVGSPNCGATVNFGAQALASVGASTGNVGRALLRFELDDATHQAMSESRVQSVTLTLTRDQGAPPGTDYGCGVGGVCAYTNGTISVFPLTNAWAEGTTGGGDGATWCHADRKSNILWGSPGASADGSDHGGLAASGQFLGEASYSIDVDPGVLTPWVKVGAGKPSLSLLLVSGNKAQLFFYAKEHPQNGGQAATLSFAICP